jgi:hypothetical protein
VVNDNRQRKKCPYCAEFILEEAIRCRFCQADLTKEPAASEAKSKEVTLTKAMLSNLFCPGLGSWKLGERGRGAIILGILLLSCLMYAGEVMPKVNKEVSKALRTGRTRGIEKNLKKTMSDNIWLDVAFWTFTYSFVDVYLIASSRKKAKKDG